MVNILFCNVYTYNDDCNNTYVSVILKQDVHNKNPVCGKP